MAALNEIKNRIKITQSTAKITNAMKLVATAKLKKYREAYQQQLDYQKKFYDIFSYVLSKNKTNILPKKETKKPITLWIVFFSSMGLCSGFNLNLVNKLQEVLSKDDIIYLFGKKGKPLFSNKNILNPVKLEIDLDDKHINYELFKVIADNIWKTFLEDKDINKIKILYTKFVNSLTFDPIIFDLIPFDEKILKPRVEFEQQRVYITFQPNVTELAKSLITDYLATCLCGANIESKLCENAARRNAMDNATNSANELIDQLKLEYNQKRQSDITQSINEITAGISGE